MRARDGLPIRSGIVSLAGLAFPISLSGIEGGRNIFTASRAWAVPQAGEQYAQVGIHIGRGAHRGARAAVGEMLVDADGWRKPVMLSTGGFAIPKATYPRDSRYWRWPFFIQDVKPQRGFTRAGHTREYDQPVLRDGNRYVFQVVQPGAAYRNLIRHLASRNINAEMGNAPYPLALTQLVGDWGICRRRSRLQIPQIRVLPRRFTKSRRISSVRPSIP